MNRLLSLAVVGLVAGFAVYFLATAVGYWQSKRTVHIIHSSEVVSSQIVSPGDAITVEAFITRLEICDPIVNRFFRDRMTGEVVHSETVPGAAGGLSENEPRQFRIRIPDDLAPGDYSYDATVVNRCEDGNFYTFAPPVNFSVTAGD